MERQQQTALFDQWIEQYRGVFFKVVTAYARTPHDQEDLFQEIATQVWNSIPTFRGEAKASTWIYRVALYAAMAWSKKEKRYTEKHPPIEIDSRILKQATKTRHPQLDWLYEQINQFDEIDRSLTLLMLDGYSYKEISTTLGISESNVGVKLNRIKKRLSESSRKEPQV